MTHQVWFDNATSLTYKYMGAASLKLRGVGIWAANFLASGDSAEDKAQRDQMWGALPRWDWKSFERHLDEGSDGTDGHLERLQYREKALHSHNIELNLLNSAGSKHKGKSVGTGMHGKVIVA